MRAGSPWVDETFEDEEVAPSRAPIARPPLQEDPATTPLRTGLTRLANLVLEQTDKRSRPSR